MKNYPMIKIDYPSRKTIVSPLIKKKISKRSLSSSEKRNEAMIFLRGYRACIAAKRDLELLLNEEYPSEEALEILRIFIDHERQLNEEG